jgi:hypothetical protein
MRKAQAALEYLMTYGWAILIIAIVAAALYYMNVFGGGCASPSATGFPTSGGVAILSNGFLIMADGTGEIVLTNNAAQSVSLSNVVIDTYTNATSMTIPAGETLTLFPAAGNLLTIGTQGGCYRFDVTVSFTRTGLTLTQTSSGTLQGAYQ